MHVVNHLLSNISNAQILNNEFVLNASRQLDWLTTILTVSDLRLLKDNQKMHCSMQVAAGFERLCDSSVCCQLVVPPLTSHLPQTHSPVRICWLLCQVYGWLCCLCQMRLIWQGLGGGGLRGQRDRGERSGTGKGAACGKKISTMCVCPRSHLKPIRAGLKKYACACFLTLLSCPCV